MQSRHAARARYVARHRPYQRLLLAALHTHTAAALSSDIMLMINAQLDKCKLSAFTRAGDREHPSHKEKFAWHRAQMGRPAVANWAGPVVEPIPVRIARPRPRLGVKRKRE